MDLILVNINKDIINRYVYIYKDKEKNSHKNIIEDKIKKVLPQKVNFLCLSQDFKNSYTTNKPRNLEEYLKGDKMGKKIY